MSRVFLFLSILFLASSCNPDDNDDDQIVSNNFDRSEMLTGWVDDVIIPSYGASRAPLTKLLTSLQSLESEGNDANLEQARTEFDAAYLAWQRQAPFLLAEAEAVRLRRQSNTYPADVKQIQENIATEANLALPSMIAAQGFPALEYLLFGTDETGVPVANNGKAITYSVRLVDRMLELQNAVSEQVKEGRSAYIANDGNSATASIDRTVNDYIFYYEKSLRAGKVGIPAGVFSDDPLADRVEGRYRGNSKALFLAALEATETFFNRDGLADYLDAVQSTGATEREPLSASIAQQFLTIKAAAQTLDDDFGQQVLTDNGQMLALYDELQKLTILLKVDMLQALSINVDYVDADGD
ncbi:imelysin family protein [Neolewinella antarctica]|uniref:Lipoprotein n=1 Tax=Neolewinella antarctica TaxID=442734 RepID=A0ABX0X7L8_9BACT|nr:imelysin family protein [Neolewinella antarctica]NJC25040.1 putative lipoprotein [Neolewinella antarctica]